MSKYKLAGAICAMIVAVTAANYLVLFPINDWLTWGTVTYPLTFFITELSNRFWGPKKARQIVYVGFVVAVIFSYALATPKIAFASGCAFLISQLLDISLFNRLRQESWWCAPLVASFWGTTLDSCIFWTAAFWGESVPVLTWAIGDSAVKFAVDIAMLLPFRMAIGRRFSPCHKTTIQDTL